MNNEEFYKDLDKRFVKAHVEYIPINSYSAITGGCESRFRVGTHEYLAKFNSGVRGINIPDMVTVTKDGEVISGLLGKCIKLDLLY